MKIVLALVLVACVAVQAAPAAKKVKGKCQRLELCPMKLVKKNGKITSEKGKCHLIYSFCPLNAAGKADVKHCRSVKKPCCHEPCKWKKVGDGHDESDGDDDEDDGAAKKKVQCRRWKITWNKTVKKNGKWVTEKVPESHYFLCPFNAKGKVDDKQCKSVKKCGSGKGKWKKVGDDGHEHFEPAPGEDDGDHKHKKCKKHKKTGDDDDDEDGDHKHKHHCKKHGGDGDGDDGDDDDDDDDDDGDHKKHKKCKKHKKNDGSDDDDSGSDGSGSDSDHKHGCKKHGSDDSGDDSD